MTGQRIPAFRCAKDELDRSRPSGHWRNGKYLIGAAIQCQSFGPTSAISTGIEPAIYLSDQAFLVGSTKNRHSGFGTVNLGRAGVCVWNGYGTKEPVVATNTTCNFSGLPWNDGIGAWLAQRCRPFARFR